VKTCKNLGHNDAMANLGGVCISVTLDTGAYITLLPAELECVEEYTGKTTIVRGVLSEPQAAPVAMVKLTIGHMEVKAKSAMIPGDQLGWEGTLALSLDDPEQVKLLGKLNDIRKEKYGKEDRRYLPVVVTREGVQDAIMVADLPQGDTRLEHLRSDNQFVMPEAEGMVVSSTQEETPEKDDNNAEAVRAEVVEGRVDKVEVVSQVVEAEGETLKEDAGNRTTDDNNPDSVVGSTRRGEIVSMTAQDETLKAVRQLADKQLNGYEWDEGLAFKYTLDQLGNVAKRLCVPKSLRGKCLEIAHERSDHLGKNKVGKELAKTFYWPSLYSDVAVHCRSCEVCQRYSKAKPRHTPMIEREIVTIPSERVAIDLVGPLPKARGGFGFLLTCIDLATRWPEAVALKKTTARIVIKNLLEFFSQNGFPGTIVSDNGPQFVGKEFESFCSENGITHTKT